jgi:hypothetical protein
LIGSGLFCACLSAESNSVSIIQRTTASVSRSLASHEFAELVGAGVYEAGFAGLRAYLGRT